tara:strand:- start:3501 stop:3860 length:360 start_codon:yes stop_codon:yes gene_type:complete
VFVVDGDAAVRDSLVTLLALNGHEVAGFATGGECLAAMDAGGNGSAEDVDCVVCEAELPDISGLELFRAFRAKHPETRFALLTSRNDQGAAAAARVCGIEAVFQKPLVSRRLRAFVQRI